MKDILIIGGKLSLICAIAALTLAGINTLTAPRIAQLQREALERGLQAVTIEGKAGSFVEQETGNMNGYYPIIKQQKTIGYILSLVGDGYGGDLNLLVSYDVDGQVLKAKLMENQETAGLGKNAEKDEYMAIYEGTGTDKPIPAWKSDLDSETLDRLQISGASVTYYGLSQAIIEGSNLVQQLKGDN